MNNDRKIFVFKPIPMLIEQNKNYYVKYCEYKCMMFIAVFYEDKNKCYIDIKQFGEGLTEQKAIDNCVDFINNILKVQFPNSEIVPHRAISNTLCPSVLSDEKFTEYFKN